MISRSQHSPASEAGRGVSARLQWRVGHTTAVCVLVVLALLFSVQRAFISGAPENDISGQDAELPGNPPSSWLRETRIEERENYYLVRMSIPEIEEGKLEVILDSGVLKVTGRRDVSRKDEGAGWLGTSELRSSFQKTCSFPGKVAPKIAETRIEDGVLLVKVGKARS